VTAVAFEHSARRLLAALVDTLWRSRAAGRAEGRRPTAGAFWPPLRGGSRADLARGRHPMMPGSRWWLRWDDVGVQAARAAMRTLTQPWRQQRAARAGWDGAVLLCPGPRDPGCACVSCSHIDPDLEGDD
jgi:hypothetical protein